MQKLMLVDVAADLRKRAGQVEPAYSTRQIVAARFPSALVTGATLRPGIEEMVSMRREGPVIVYSRALSGPSQRFAIGHALAHLLFDDSSAAACAGRPGVRANEEQADAFAAELLAPLDELAPYVGRYPSEDPEEHELYLDQVDEIASHFVLPARVIDRRIRELAATLNGITLSLCTSG